MLVALLAAREVLPPGTARTLRKVSVADFNRARGQLGILFHHGDLTISRTAVVPSTAITGNLVVDGALVDCCSGSSILTIAGNLTARSIGFTGTIVVGGDITVDGALVAYGDPHNFRGVKPRPLRVGGSLRAPILVIGSHDLACAGKITAEKTLALPRDVERFITAVRAFDNKQEINAGMLRAKVLSGARFLT
jgi:hypothetical protein